jgi:hypothetical protein
MSNDYRHFQRRRTVLKTIGALGVAGAFAGTASGATVTVSPGDSIQTAVNAAAPGDTIHVEAGTYAETVVVDKALTLVGPNDGVHPEYDTRGPEAVVTGFRLAADGVTITGFRIANGTKGVATVGNNTVRSDITLEFNDFHTLSEWPVLHGFGFGGGIGSADWTVSHNRISNITGDAITAIVLFNVDGVTLERNYVEHATTSASGRRGHNLDGCTAITMTDCYVDMGLRGPANTGANFTAARYSLQLSMSGRAVSDVTITGNTFRGGYDGLVTLGNGDISDVDIEDNEVFDNVIGMRFQAGTNAPAGAVDDVRVWRNDLAGMFWGLFLQGTDPYTAFVATLNDLSDNENAGLRVDAGVVTTDGIDAERNWWGSRDGPDADTLTDPDGLADTRPWLRNGTAAGAVPGNPSRGG